MVARLPPPPSGGVFSVKLSDMGRGFSIQVEKREGDVRSRLKDGIQKADVTKHPTPLNPLPSIILSLRCPLSHCFHADAPANTIPPVSRKTMPANASRLGAICLSESPRVSLARQSKVAKKAREARALLLVQRYGSGKVGIWSVYRSWNCERQS